jgi:hypothetical protein
MIPKGYHANGTTVGNADYQRGTVSRSVRSDVMPKGPKGEALASAGALFLPLTYFPLKST